MSLLFFLNSETINVSEFGSMMIAVFIFERAQRHKTGRYFAISQINSQIHVYHTCDEFEKVCVGVFNNSVAALCVEILNALCAA